MARLFSLAICHFGMAVYGQGWEPAFVRYGVSEGLSSSGLYSVLVDRENRVWVGSGKGLDLYDGTSFRSFSKRDGMIENRAIRIFEDEQGRIWSMGSQNQLSYYEGGEIKPYRFNQVLKDSLPPRQAMTDFAFDEIGNLYVTFRSGKHRTIRVDTLGNYQYQVGFPEKVRLNVIDCGRKQLLYCQFPKGIGGTGPAQAENRFVITKGWENPKEVPSQTFCAPTRVVRSGGAVRLKDGRWVVNGAWGLWGQLEIDGPMVTINKERSTVCMMVDSDGWLWTGSYTKGVSVFHPDNLLEPMYHWIMDDGVSGLAEDQEGGIWMAGSESGLYYCANKNVLHKEWEDGMPSRDLPDKYGNRYQFVAGEGVRIMKDGIQKRFLNLPYFMQGIPKDSSFMMFYGPYGVKIYDPVKEKLIEDVIPSTNGVSNGDEYSDSTMFLHEKGKMVEVGINGIVREWSFPIPFRVGRATAEGNWYLANDEGFFLVRGDSIEKIYPASDSEFVQVKRISKWKDKFLLSTNGNGLVIVGKDATLNLTTEDGLSSNFIRNVLGLGDGRFMVLSTKGVDLLETSPVINTFGHLNELNGFGKNGVSEVIQIEDSIRFVSPRGLCRFPRSELLATPAKLKTPLLEVFQEGQPVPDSVATFPHDQNEFVFGFKNIQYQQSIEYRYQLVGLDRTWVTTSQTTARYPGLKPGNYEFNVQSHVLGDIWENAGTSRRFVVHPPFWLTWWFIGLAILALAGIIYLLVRRKFEADRRRSLVKNELANLKGEALRSQMNPHFTFNALNSIQSFITGNDKEKAANFLSSFAKVMRMFLEYSREDLITLDEEIVLLEEYLTLEKMRFQEKFNFSVEVAEDLNRYQCPVPPILIQPLVENALIHGILPAKHETELKIFFQLEEENLLKCVVWDNGVGIAPSAKEKAHRSLGLQLVRDRLANLEKAGFAGGKFYLEEGELHGVKGTCSTILIPIDDI